MVSSSVFVSTGARDDGKIWDFRLPDTIQGCSGASKHPEEPCDVFNSLPK